MINPGDFELSLEQQFALTNYQRQAEQLPKEQLAELFESVVRQNMIKDNVIRHLVKEVGL